MTESSTPKKKRSLLLPISLAIIAIAIIGFVASRAGLDKALVKQQLDRFAIELKEKGRQQGRDLDFSYGNLEVEGSFAKKHVVIHDVVLRMKPLERVQPTAGEKKKTDALAISTPRAAIYPLSADLSSLRVEVPEPINFADEDAPDRSLLKIKSDVPLSVTLVQKKLGERNVTEVNYPSPNQLLLTYLREQQATGAEEATPTVVPVYQNVNITLAPGGSFTSRMANDDSRLGEAKLALRDIVITPQEAPEGAINVAEITANWSNALNERQLNTVTAFLKAGPVTSDNADAPYLPLMANLDATYEGAITNAPQTVAEAKGQQSSMVIKQLSVTSKDTALNATANFAATTGDVLPVGTANIALTNLPYVLAELRTAGMLDEKDEPLIHALLAQITGQPIETLQDLNIAVERPRDGSFKIGNATFEELFALFLKQAMQAKANQLPDATGAAPATLTSPTSQAPLVPQLPPADKPKSVPIAVPDHGVRG